MKPCLRYGRVILKSKKHVLENISDLFLDLIHWDQCIYVHCMTVWFDGPFLFITSQPIQNVHSTCVARNVRSTDDPLSNINEMCSCILYRIVLMLNFLWQSANNHCVFQFINFVTGIEFYVWYFVIWWDLKQSQISSLFLVEQNGTVNAILLESRFGNLSSFFSLSWSFLRKLVYFVHRTTKHRYQRRHTRLRMI